MDADGARHLREAHDRPLDFRGRGGHEVGHLVDDDDDVRQPVLHAHVVTREILRVHTSEQVEAAVHFTQRPFERVHGFRDFRDDRRDEVRDTVVHLKLDALRIHHDEFHVIGTECIEIRHDEHVQPHGFTGPGRAGNKQVRHLGEIGRPRLARDVLAEHEREASAPFAELLGLEHFAHADGRDGFVWDLHADEGLAGNRRLDADRVRGQRQREIVVQRRDAGELDAVRGLERELRDGRSDRNLGHLDRDAEILERAPDHFAVVHDIAGGRLIVAAVEQVERDLDARVALLGLWPWHPGFAPLLLVLLRLFFLLFDLLLARLFLRLFFQRFQCRRGARFRTRLHPRSHGRPQPPCKHRQPLPNEIDEKQHLPKRRVEHEQERDHQQRDEQDDAPGQTEHPRERNRNTLPELPASHGKRGVGHGSQLRKRHGMHERIEGEEKEQETDSVREPQRQAVGSSQVISPGHEDKRDDELIPPENIGYAFVDRTADVAAHIEIGQQQKQGAEEEGHDGDPLPGFRLHAETE